MRKRRKVLVILGLIALAAVCFVTLWPPAEPKYQGVYLAEWLELFGDGEGSPRELEAKAAILAIGTNALPYFVNWISYETPAPQATFHRWVNLVAIRVNPNWAVVDRKHGISTFAPYGFQVFGSNAAPAVPALQKLMNHGTPRESLFAAQSLSFIGRPGLPALMKALGSDRKPLGDAAVFALSEMGADARPAIPMLLEQLNDHQYSVRFRAVITLGQLGLEPETVVPALTNRFAEGAPLDAIVIESLGLFTTNGITALPLILQLLNDSDQRLRFAATNAITMIAPEILTNTPVQ